ncbi:MAG: hypothetical protein AB7S81_09295, partial [Bdellovibrionales bacterium]
MLKVAVRSVVSVTLLCLALPAYAQVPLPEKNLYSMEASVPDVTAIPFIKGLLQQGMEIHYMGTRSGLHGFLLLRQGQLQMLYVTPDKRSVIIGGLFSEDGQLVTTGQIQALAKTNKKVEAVLTGAAAQQIDLVRAGVQEGGMAELPESPDAATALAENELKRMPLLIASPGEQLIQDLKAASGVSMGNEDAPELLMVVSPNCYFCKKTWEELKGAVKEGKIHMRLIPIARNPEGGEIRVAAKLLRSENPFQDWDAYVSGDHKVLAGEPDKMAYRAIEANRTVIDRWNILGTPYLVYRAQKDKKIKIVQ